jgi:hypothetical protein
VNLSRRLGSDREIPPQVYQKESDRVAQGRAALEDKRRMLADMRELSLCHHDRHRGSG